MVKSKVKACKNSFCENTLPKSIRIDGKRKRLSNKRKLCLTCRPYEPREEAGNRTCENPACNKEFPKYKIIEGRRIRLRRKFCLDCSPLDEQIHWNTVLTKHVPKIKYPGTDILVNIRQTCTKCSNEKDAIEFSLRRERGNLEAICKECRNKRRTELRQKKKNRIVEYKGGCCSKCKYDTTIYGLSLHHRDPNEKDKSLISFSNKNFNRIKSELDKCELLCENCHREVHYELFIERSNGKTQRYQWKRNKKREYVEHKGGACLLCGYDHYEGALDFHHLNPKEKEFQITHLYYKGLDYLKAELDKCILVCANCHAEIHAGLHEKYLVK